MSDRKRHGFILLIVAGLLAASIVALFTAKTELGLDLPKTTAKVKAALAGLPLEIREGPSTSGLIAILRGPATGGGSAMGSEQEREAVFERLCRLDPQAALTPLLVGARGVMATPAL